MRKNVGDEFAIKAYTLLICLVKVGIPQIMWWSCRGSHFNLHMSLGLDPLHMSSSWELKLAIVKSLIYGDDKLSYKAQTIESLNNLQTLKSLSMCKVAMFNAKYQEGIILDNEVFITNQRRLKAHWPRAQNMSDWALNLPKLPHGLNLGCWLRACCSLSIWIH